MRATHRLSKASTLVAFAAALAASPLFAADPARNTLNFDKDWHFLKGDADGAQAPAFDDKSWRTLDVPHDWAIEGPFEANAPTRGSGAFAPSGISWYRKSFTLPASAAGKTVAIELDGVMANSEVFINGKSLGKRPYGYVGLHYDLTPNLVPGQNVIAVKTDTSAQPASRYYFGAGIVRHTRLVIADPLHIDYHGTFVTTPKVSPAAATVHLKTTVVNTSNAGKPAALHITLNGPDGKPAGSATSQSQMIAPGQTADLEADLTVNNPTLWDLEKPALYTATASLDANGKTLDDQTVNFGIRDAEFKPETGFWLNGKNFKLKGVCLHADIPGFGLAVPEDAWIHRLEILKQYGANAVRTAHNPPSPEFLDACDKVGMLVMDEMFDCWTVAKTGQGSADYHLYFKEWNLVDTRDTVRRDRNHPSIILYSAGNEIHDTPKSAVAIPILQGLVKTFHENDPTRPVTQALFRPNSDDNGGAYKNGLADLLDVVGTNYRDKELLAAQKEKPIKIVGTEQGRTLAVWTDARDNPGHSGQFIWTGVDYLGETFAYPSIGAGAGVLDATDYPKAEALDRASWWSTQPVVYMARTVARAPGGRGGAGRGRGAPGVPVDDNPDNPMPLNPGAAPAAPGGAAAPVANDGFVYTAAPAPAPNAGRGAGRGGARGGGAGGGAPGGGAGGGGGAGPGAVVDWTPANLQPHPETVQVYSNAEEVELFLNDQSLGTKKRGDLLPPGPNGNKIDINAPRTFNVDFAPGTLKAVARNNGKEVAANVLTTAGKASKISLTPSTTSLANDFDHVAYVSVDITDDKGTLVPAATDHVKFSITGPGEIISVSNAHLVAQDFRAPEHDAYNGRITLYVRSTKDAGPITLTATSPNLATSTLTLNAAPAKLH